MHLVDAWMAAYPRRQPTQSAIENCKIISHRGVHDNRTVLENTVHAFDTAAAAGVWGIEADIRWTADLTPVIHHDADTWRVFGKSHRIGSMSCEDLQKAVPSIPTLDEFIARYGGKLHLMLELKDEPFPLIEKQKEILRAALARLTAVRDYHFLALDPDLFKKFDIQPRDCCLSVAQAEVRQISEKTVGFGYGGFTGHYLLLNDRVKHRHEMAGQSIGTGFIRSRNCLFRELNRGVEWIFTNDAPKLQAIVDKIKNTNQ